MPEPIYLPTRHELLAVAAFHRRIHAHRQIYIHVEFDLPVETFRSLIKNHEQVDKNLLSVVKGAERLAGLRFVEERMGLVFAKNSSGEIERLKRGWINARKWEAQLLKRISRRLGYCAVHDAFFEITLGVGMERFGGTVERPERAVVVVQRSKSTVLRIGMDRVFFGSDEGYTGSVWRAISFAQPSKDAVSRVYTAPMP